MPGKFPYGLCPGLLDTGPELRFVKGPHYILIQFNCMSPIKSRSTAVIKENYYRVTKIVAPAIADALYVAFLP